MIMKMTMMMMIRIRVLMILSRMSILYYNLKSNEIVKR